MEAFKIVRTDKYLKINNTMSTNYLTYEYQCSIINDIKSLLTKEQYQNNVYTVKE